MRSESPGVRSCSFKAVHLRHERIGVLEIEKGGEKNMTSSFHVVIHSYIDLIKGG